MEKEGQKAMKEYEKKPVTEYEKMMRGVLYDPSDDYLSRLRREARQATIRFNRTDEDETATRREILEGLLGAIGPDTYIEPNIRFDYGCNTYIGNDCYFNFDSVFLDCARIQIGNQVFAGPRLSLLTPMHAMLADERNVRTDENGRKYDLEYCRPITIGDNVWLGGNVTVNPGVTIGHDTVIGSGSVVTRDIPSGVFAAGNPCRVIRKLTGGDRLHPGMYV